MKKIHPFTFIVFGVLCVSLLINIAQHRTIETLKYHIQKIEAGPWKGIFDKREDKKEKLIPDEQMREIIKKMLDKMFDEQKKKNIT